MTCEEYCKSREGKEWLAQDTDYVLGHIRDIEKLAQDCMLDQTRKFREIREQIQEALKTL